MADTSIEWAEKVWNCLRGCTYKSAGCTNCYAPAAAVRMTGPGQPYEGIVRIVNNRPVWTGKVVTVPEKLEYPLHVRKPTRWFVNSMSDWAHEQVPDEFLDQMFAVMGACPQHTFLLLTKRPERMLEYMRTRGHRAWNLLRLETEAYPPRNIWLGVSVEDQATADERIPDLLSTPAAVRWVSYEPALGPVDWRHVQTPEVEIDALAGTHGVIRPHRGTGPRLDWIVAGGESGPNARPAHPDWFRQTRDQCQQAGVAFFFKQWGEFGPVEPHHKPLCTDVADDTVIGLARVGKKAAGRVLDGRTWDQYPETTHANVQDSVQAGRGGE